jgi:predicted nucleic acid-binding protein
VAFANRADVHHERAVEIAQRMTEPLLTCEAVLAETAFHLRSTRVTLAMVNEGLVRLAFSVAGNLAQLAALATRTPTAARTSQIFA